MKFNCTTKINVPRGQVVDLFKEEEIMKESQGGFIKKEILSGDPWKEGSKSRMLYKKMELTETILQNSLPEEFKALYEHKHMVNTMHCAFTALDPNTTRLDQEIHYTEFRGIIPKIMAALFPGLFKKQVQKWLEKFRDVVEERFSEAGGTPPG